MLLCIFAGNFATAQLKADFTADNTSGCTPLIVQFSDASTGSPTKWKWDFGNGAFSTVQNPSVIFVDPGTYNVKLIIQNVSGSDSVIKAGFIKVYAKPDVQFSASPTSGCSVLPVKFTDQSSAGSGTITQWIWDFGDGQVSTTQNPVHSYAVSDTFGVSLSVTNSFGCQQILQKPAFVNVSSNVTAGFSYSYTNACQPPTVVNFNNNSVSKNVLSYQWSFGDGSSSSSVNPSHTFNSTGTYIIKLISITDLGCSDTAIQNISIGTVSPDFSFNPGACTNFQVSFTNRSSPAPVSVTWSFGDGGTSTNKSPSHAYTTAGSYDIKLTADFGSCLASVTKTINVLDKPKAGFSATGSLVQCRVPSTVQFTNSSAGAVSYKWLFGDGDSSTASNPSHNYITAGFYTVKLVAFNSNGCSDTLVIPNLIKLGPPKTLGLINLPYRGCAPAYVNFSANVKSAEQISSYLWNFGDGSTSTDSSVKHAYAAKGTYDISLVVKSSGGCTDTFHLPAAVSLGNAPHAQFSIVQSSVCASTFVEFQDKSTGQITGYKWNFGDGSPASYAQNPKHIYKDTGTFDITLYVFNNGCLDSAKMKSSVHVSPPYANFSVGFKCYNNFTRDFHDKSVGASTLSWDFGDGTTSTQNNPSHTFASKGTYIVKFIVTNGSCTDVKSDTLQVVDEHPSFTYSPVNLNFCKYDSVTFAATNYDPTVIS